MVPVKISAIETAAPNQISPFDHTDVFASFTFFLPFSRTRERGKATSRGNRQIALDMQKAGSTHLRHCPQSICKSCSLHWHYPHQVIRVEVSDFLSACNTSSPVRYLIAFSIALFEKLSMTFSAKKSAKSTNSGSKRRENHLFPCTFTAAGQTGASRG